MVDSQYKFYIAYIMPWSIKLSSRIYKNSVTPWNISINQKKPLNFDFASVDSLRLVSTRKLNTMYQ